VTPDDVLSPREIQIARSYADGQTYHAIATDLCIAPSTVRTHLAAIYRKLEVSSKLELRARLDGSGLEAGDRTDQAGVISELALSLEDSIRREKVLSEVLNIISRSGGDIDAVMEAILGYALELCDAEFGTLFDYHGELRFSALFSGGIPGAFLQWLNQQGTFQVAAQTGLGRMATTRETVNIIDVRAEGIYRSGDPLRHATADLGGARSFVAIPMLGAEGLVGAFTIYRQRVRPFGGEATAIAQRFAALSVIAIENARMISALRAMAPAAARG